MTASHRLRFVGSATPAILLLVAVAVSQAQTTAPRTGRQVYESTCVTCHGP